MVTFDIYIKEVEIETCTGKQILRLRPLSGRFLPKLYSVLKSFGMGGTAVKPEELFDSLDEITIKNIHELILETLKKSYPEQKEVILDEFVSQNLLKLINALVEVNLGVLEDGKQ